MNKETLKMLCKQIGGLQVVLGYILGLPFLVSLIFGEYYSALGFLTSSILILIIGYSFYKGFETASEPLSRHAFIIAALGWLSIMMMGSLPFLIIAYVTPAEVLQAFVPEEAEYTSSILYFKNPLHAIFESISTFTTTGLTMAVHEPSIGKGLLFYRSLGQWIGELVSLCFH